MGDQKLEWAVDDVDVAKIEKLVIDRVDVNAWDANGETFLFRAARAGNLHVCAALILSTADPNLKARDGRKAVDHVAEKGGQTRNLQLLLRMCGGLDLKGLGVKKPMCWD